MTATEDDVQRWFQAGLIDERTAERILAFEADRVRGERARPQRPGLTELLVYFGVGIAAAGFSVLTATNWEHLATSARIAIPLVSAAIALSAGQYLRQNEDPAMLRAASLLWLLGGVLSVVTGAVASNEAGWSEEDVALAAGLTAAVVSLALWMLMRTHSQVVGIGAAAFLLSIAVSTRAAEDWILAVLGGLLAFFGLAAMVATESNVLVPRTTARLVAAAALTAGAFWAGLPPSPPVAELVTLLVLAVLVTAGVRFQSLQYISFGVLAAFSGLIKLILRHVEDPTIAGLALVVIGLMFSALAVVGVRISQRRSSLPVAGTGPKAERTVP